VSLTDCPLYLPDLQQSLKPASIAYCSLVNHALNDKISALSHLSSYAHASAAYLIDELRDTELTSHYRNSADSALERNPLELLADRRCDCFGNDGQVIQAFLYQKPDDPVGCARFDGEYATANDGSDCSEKLALQDKVAPTFSLAELPSRVDTWMVRPSSLSDQGPVT
jgi:hypothetical protein